jgi:hypothetical protein
MFEEFAAMVERVRLQYTEGAITAEEYFNKVAFEVVELTNTPAYATHLDTLGVPVEEARA